MTHTHTHIHSHIKSDFKKPGACWPAAGAPGLIIEIVGLKVDALVLLNESNKINAIWIFV